MNTSIRQLVVLPGLAVALLSGTSATAEEKVNFEKQVLPVLKEKCLKCHVKKYVDKRGRTKKPKSGLRLDGAKFYKIGGDIQADEDKKVIVPGKSGESTFYTFSMLDEEDDLFMPPKGDPLTTEEKDLIKKWIDEGADFGGWKGDEGEE